MNNGGDYVASRRALLNQYAARWLLAFHDQDVRVYASVLYDICTDLAEDTSPNDEFFLGLQEVITQKVGGGYLTYQYALNNFTEAERELC